MYLLHVQVFWWGRISKILQLIGSMTVIAEIVGYKRLGEFGDRLRQGQLRHVAGGLVHRVRQGLDWYGRQVQDQESVVWKGLTLLPPLLLMSSLVAWLVG